MGFFATALPSGSALLVLCRLRRDSRRTQGQAEAVDARAARGVEGGAVRRPAIRRAGAPTAATERAVEALFGTERINDGLDTVVVKPIMRPLKQIAVQVKQATK